MKNRNILHIIPLLLAFFVTNGCTKTEYLPMELGEPIPNTDTAYMSLEEVLGNSPYTLFYQAWQRSSLREVLAEESSAQAYTFLVLDNTALGTAGWNAARISAASAEELDDLLGPYVLRENISRQRLQQQPAAVIADSYATVTGIYWYDNPFNYGHANSYKEDNAYYQKAVLKLSSEGVLAVNGHYIGISDAISTDRATLWPVRETLRFDPRPTWQVLKEDGRFGLYTSIVEWTDSVYNDLFYRLNGYLPAARPNTRNYVWVDNHYHDTPRQQGMVPYTGTDGLTYVDPLNTWFIPTDEAFRKAGFQTLQDLIRFNETQQQPVPIQIPQLTSGEFYFYRANVYYYNPAFTGLDGYFATDYLLDYHGLWGMRSRGFTYWESRGSTFLFSNDLIGTLNQDLQLASISYQIRENGDWRYLTESHNSPIVALSQNELWVPGLDVDRVHISESDIYTLNGVIHVVDDLFQPNKIQ